MWTYIAYDTLTVLNLLLLEEESPAICLACKQASNEIRYY